MSLSYRLSERSAGVRPSAMANVLKWVMQPGIFSFAGGMPDPSLFPMPEIVAAAETVRRTAGNAALQYCPARGHAGLREYFRGHFAGKGIHVDVDDILPVCGAQQGIHLTCQLFLDPGDTILALTPCYFGALQAFDAFLVKYRTIELTEDGIDLAKLEDRLRTRPKFFYVIPSFQNPSGRSIPLEQRPLIVELARKYGVPILEDDVFGDLYFKQPLPPLKSFDPENVIYLTSVSKTLSSGIRVGFLVAPRSLCTQYVLLKELTDVNVNTFAQHIIHEVCANGTFERILPDLRRQYCARRDALLKALKDFYAPHATWNVPLGGMFLWIELKGNMRADNLLALCVQRGLVFVPGASFFPESRGGECAFRCSFSNLDPSRLARGVELLAQCTADCSR